MGSKQEFIDFIKEELVKRNWSHAELSRRSGISQAHISRVINSGYQPGINFFKSISKTLNLSGEFILRIAGELPEKDEKDSIKDRITTNFRSLTEEDQKSVYDFIQFLLYRKNK